MDSLLRSCSGLAEDLKGVWVECSAEFVSPVFFIYLFFILSPQQVLTYIVVYTYSKIKSHKKPYKIFDFNSRDSTFYNAIEKRGDVSSMQLICRTKQRKQILPPKTERYEAKINK